MAQTAIVGEKVGMTQKWVDDRMLAVTVLRVEPMRVVQIKTTGAMATRHYRSPTDTEMPANSTNPTPVTMPRLGFSQDADSLKSASIRSMALRLAKKSPSISSPLATALTLLG